MRLHEPGFTSQVATLIHEARDLTGWSQRELADRASTSQSTVSRIERGVAREPDLLVVERLLDAFGFRVTLDIAGAHLEDRRRQRDAVHSVLTGFVSRRLRRAGWQVALEVQIGDAVPRGWIDLLAFRDCDASLLVEETKTDILDAGALLRQLRFYEREATRAAQRLGWRAERTRVLLIALDSSRLADRLRANQGLLGAAFPAAVRDMGAWIKDPGRPAPAGWSLAVADPRSRSPVWLKASSLRGGTRVPAFADYRDAAQLLVRDVMPSRT